MDYVILDSKKRDFQIRIILIQIKPFEKPGPGALFGSSEISWSYSGDDVSSRSQMNASRAGPRYKRTKQLLRAP